MKGEAIYVYAFDVANEIVTPSVREILARRPLPYEITLSSAFPKDVPLYRPLSIEVPEAQVRVEGQAARVTIRVFEVGVVDVVMRVPVTATSLHDLVPYHHPHVEGAGSLDEVARRLCLEVCTSIHESLVQSSPPSQPEAYTVFLLTDLDGERDVERWFETHRRSVAGVLNEVAPDRLSEAQVEESVRVRRSFGPSDLVVIDWDASLMVDLDAAAEDVLYVLELANLQLEELQVMDRRLDRHMERAYGDLERYRSPWIGSPTRMHHWLRRFRVDATKLTDEVTNIAKLSGDWYLARVYLGARERFHLQQWRESIDERLGHLDRLYTVLQGDVHERRMLVLEVAIVICFLVDLFAIFFWSR